MRVCVIGLGYIGFPLAVVLARSGHRVRGVDTDTKRVEAIRSGTLEGIEPSLDALGREAVVSGFLDPAETVSPSEIFVVAVPTPLDENRRADLSHVEKAVDSIAPCLEPGNLVVIESTVPVGTTERMACRLLEKRPDLASEKGTPSFLVAHCPERVLPGSILEELLGVDRIVGGINPESTSSAAGFYSSFVQGTVHSTDVRTAEMCKLVENASRDVSIAFANEVSMICSRMGVDSSALVRLANRHPRVRIMEPGPGVGGHCIPVDPWFLVESAPLETLLIQSARKVNEAKTEWVLRRIEESVSRFENPAVACLGLAYKPDVNDLRESPALSIAVSLCSERGFSVRVVEPHIRELPPSLGLFRNCRLTGLGQALSEAHVVALLTRHREFEGLPEGLRAGTVFIDPNGSVQEVGPEAEGGKRP
jgi:UDP-N-acetyl-D-mannosaminuronic acid dehydrogenase